MSVITDAIINHLLNDPKLCGTKDGNGNWIAGTGMLSLMQEKRWNGTALVTKNVPAIYSYLDYTELVPPAPPPGVPVPYVAYLVAAGHISDVPSLRFGSKGKRARDIVRDILCFYKQDGNDKTNDFDYSSVEAIAERVYELFDKKDLVIPDPADPENYTKWKSVKCRANGPILLEPEERSQYKLSSTADIMQVTISFTLIES